MLTPASFRLPQTSSIDIPLNSVAGVLLAPPLTGFFDTPPPPLDSEDCCLVLDLWIESEMMVDRKRWAATDRVLFLRQPGEEARSDRAESRGEEM